MRILLCSGWLFLGTALSTEPKPVALEIPQDGSWVEVLTTSVGEPKLSVSCLLTKGGPAQVLGRSEVRSDRIVFTPSLPFLPGQRYRAEWMDDSGVLRQAEFGIQALSSAIPTVRMLPESPLPAKPNTRP